MFTTMPLQLLSVYRLKQGAGLDDAAVVEDVYDHAIAVAERVQVDGLAVYGAGECRTDCRRCRAAARRMMGRLVSGRCSTGHAARDKRNDQRAGSRNCDQGRAEE